VRAFFNGAADAWAELHLWVLRQIDQGYPHATCTRLEEWEDALGLPDCLRGSEDYKARRRDVLSKLAYPQLAQLVEDGSAAAPAAIAAVLAAAGYPARVTLLTSFRAGSSSAGDPLGWRRERLGLAPGVTHVGPDYPLSHHVAGPLLIHLAAADACTRFAAGSSSAGDPLGDCRQPHLECLLNRLAPARFHYAVLIEE